jgi:VCBS repeat-containing protein
LYLRLCVAALVEETRVESELVFGSETDDTFFAVDPGATQLAAMPLDAAPYPDALTRPFDAAQVVIPAGENIVRLTVTPGEVIQLPFPADAVFLARIENGNLAIKVGDVTIILQGYVEAAGAAAPVIEAANGRPIDVAAILAATDPEIDIQTAAGPAEGAPGQGADNTGGILTPFGAGTGLGGFAGVGSQDGTDGVNGPDREIISSNGTPPAQFDLTPANLAPTAPDEKAKTDEDSGVKGQVVATDPEGNPLTYALVTGPAAGQLIFNPDGSWSYDPDQQFEALKPGQTDSVTFTYKANDGTSDSNTATVSIEIAGVNDAPAALDDKTQTDEDSTFGGQLAANDAETDPLTYLLVTGPAAGKLTFNADGSWSYDPDRQFETLKAGETDSVSFTYKANDGSLDSNAATVTIKIAGVNDAPTAQDDKAQTDEDSAVSGQVAATDAESDSLTYSLVAGPAAGKLTFNADGSWSYDPDRQFETLKAGETDSVTFTYKANDGSLESNTASVTIEIAGINDAPMAPDDKAQTDENAAVNGQVIATDAETDPLTYALVTGPAKGKLTFNADGTWSYDPDGQFDGLNVGESDSISFTYKANDGGLDSNTGTVTIEIAGMNQAPTVRPVVVFGQDEEFSAAYSLVSFAQDPDTPSNLLTFSPVDAVPAGVTLDANGQLKIDYAGSYDYLVDGEVLPWSFQYQVFDGNSYSNAAVISGLILGLNDAASITGDKTGAATEDSGIAATGTLTVKDLDAGESHTETVASAASDKGYGTWSVDADGHWSYQIDNGNAAVNQLGPTDQLTDTFTIKSQDGTAQQQVTVTINGVDDAPTAQPVAVIRQDEEFSATYSLAGLAGDPDTPSNLLAFYAVGAVPAGVTLDPDGRIHITYGGNYDYLVAGEVLSWSFEYQVFDGSSYSNAAVISGSILGLNDAATFSGERSGVTIEDSGIATSGRLIVLDPDAGEAHTQAVSNATSDQGYGTWSVDADGHWRYQADNSNAEVNKLGPNDQLIDTFTIKSQDGSAQQQVVVAILGNNDAPSVVGGSLAQQSEEYVSSFSLTQYSADPETPSNLLTYVASSLPAGVTVDPDGQVNVHYAGKYDYLVEGEVLNWSFDFAVLDGITFSSFATFTGSILGSNDAASIFGDNSGTVLENSGIAAINKLTVFDPDVGQAHTETVTNAASDFGYGTWSVDADGNWSYRLDDGNAAVDKLGPADQLIDSFTIKSQDGTAQQQITITIIGDNDAPVAVNDTWITNQLGSFLTIPEWALTINDTDAEGQPLDVTDVASVLPDQATHTAGVGDEGFVTFKDFLGPGGNFTYKATDGTAGSAAAATVTQTLLDIRNLTGTADHEILQGNERNNTIDGRGGSDVIFGGAGDDTLIFHGGDIVQGGSDSVASSGGLSADAGNRGDVLASVDSVDLTGLDLNHFSSIETISLSDAETGGTGAQNLTIGASQVTALSDHTITPGNLFTSEKDAVRIDGDSVDQLYLSISKDGGSWTDTGVDVNGYHVFAHETTAGNPATADAYVMVQAANVANVHLNQDAP